MYPFAMIILMNTTSYLYSYIRVLCLFVIFLPPNVWSVFYTDDLTATDTSLRTLLPNCQLWALLIILPQFATVHVGNAW